MLIGTGSQAMAATVEYTDADKVKWEINTTDGTAKLLNMIHLIGRGNVVLPDYVNYNGKDYKITAIGKKACINNGSLTGLTLGKFVEMIDSAAYTGSNKLAKVVLPDGIKTIGIRAFAGCSELDEINIPQSITEIGSYSFQGSKLTGFTFSANVTKIGDNPFRSCGSLKNITVENGNPNYCSKDGVLFTKDMKRLIAYPTGNGLTSYSIPEGVVVIGDNSMRNNNAMKELTMPSTLETIGEMALGLTALKQVNISRNVRTIGAAAFYMMSSLEGFTVDPGNAYYKSGDGTLLTKDGKTLMASIMRTGGYTIPAGVEKIGKYVFYGNSGLSSVNLQGVRTVGTHAFYNCSKLTEVNFGEVMEMIDTMAFQNCGKIEEISFPASMRTVNMQAFCYAAGLKKITFNEGLSFIGNMAFYGCNFLNSVSIPGTVRFSEEGAPFYNCGALRTVTLGEGIEIIPSLSFSNCPLLRQVKVPSTLRRIGDAAFQMTTSLKSFDFPAGLLYIDETAFNRSSISGDIVIPEGVKVLSRWAFTSTKITSFTASKNMTDLMDHSLHGCDYLAEVRLNEGLKFIGTNALSILPALKSLWIPPTVTQMDSLCINYNTNMTDLIMAPVTPPAVNGLLSHYIDMKKDGVDWNPFEYTTLHVPEGCVDAYRNHPEWGRFVNIIGDANGVSATTGDAETTIVDIFDLQGHRLATPAPGKVNIIRYSDGTVRKVMVPRQ